MGMVLSSMREEGINLPGYSNKRGKPVLGKMKGIPLGTTSANPFIHFYGSSTENVLQYQNFYRKLVNSAR